MNPYIFDVGSYWIYIDSMSAQPDSMYIYDVDLREQFHGSSHSHATLQEFVMRYNHFFSTDKRSQVIALTSIWLNWIPDGPMLYSSNTFKDSGGMIKQWFGRRVPVVNILGTEYHNTSVNDIGDQDDLISGNFQRMYFQDSIGVIRCEEYQNHQLTKLWNLQRFTVKHKIL